MAADPRTAPAGRAGEYTTGSPLRIDYLSTSELISDRANAVHAVRMSEALAGFGHEVTLHCLEGSGENDSEVFRYFGASRSFDLRRYRVADHASLRALVALRRYRLPTGPAVRALHGLLALRRQVRRGSGTRGDSGHFFFARNPEWLLACLTRDSRFIYESHQPPCDLRDHFINHRLFGHPGFLGLVVISKPLRTAYLSAYPRLSPAKVLVSPDGAGDVREVQCQEDGRSPRIQVGHVGHLYPGRGGELMIAVAHALPGMDFHLVGGRGEDIARLNALDPPGNLVFHGHRPPAELAGFYRRFDVVMAPYQKKVAVAGGEGNTVEWMSPLKIFEYMAYAKPIVASDLPVLHEVLVPDRTAIMVEPGNVAAWTRALSRLMESPEERRGLGRRARAAFVSRYTWRRRAERILDTFQAGGR